MSGRPGTMISRAARSIAVASARISRAPDGGGQRGKVDVRLRVRVVAAQQAGQHAGIRRFWLAPDQRQAHAGFGLHGEAAQDLHMGVAGAKQDDVRFDWAGLKHPGRLQGCCPSPSQTQQIFFRPGR